MKKIILLFLTLGLCLAQGDYELAKKHYDSKEYDKAYKLLNKACNDDEMRACSLLGLMYADGSGVQKDYKKAFDLFSKACNGGDVKGCLYLEDLQKACEPEIEKSCKENLDSTNSNLENSKNLDQAGQNLENSKLDEAMNFLNKGEYLKAREILSNGCEKNDFQACYELGKIYADAQGVKQDYKKALELFNKSCENGHLDACFFAGAVYSQDEDGIKDEKKALEFYKKVCEGKNGEGCYRIGILLDLADKKDEAIKAYKLGCEYDFSISCEAFGYFSDDNQTKAQFYAKGCILGQDSSCDELGGLYALNKDVQKFYQSALENRQKACDSKDGSACYSLALLYKINDKGEIKDDEKKANEIIQKACKDGVESACIHIYKNEETSKNLALFYEKKCNSREYEYCQKYDELFYVNMEGVFSLPNVGIEYDINKVFKMYESSCAAGYKKHCALLSQRILDAASDQEDKDKKAALYKSAFKPATKGCEAGNGAGCYTLAVLYLNGYEIKEDINEFYKNLEKSCEYGDLRGCEWLKEIPKQSDDVIAQALWFGQMEKYEKAIEIYKSECDKNNDAACTNLGVMYVNGQGVEKNEQKAVEFYKKACENKSFIACHNLAGLYLNPTGRFEIKRDVNKAKEYYTKACDLDDGLSCRMLGEIAQNSILIKNEDGENEFISFDELKSDEKIAFEFYKKACDLGEYSGCYSLGLMQAKNNETKMALRNQAKACLAPLNEACNELKNLYEKFKDEEHKKANNYKKDFDEALKMYNSGKEAQAVLSLKKLCKVGFDDACIKLYKAYQKGSEKISQDTQKALLVLDKACINGMAKSCAKLGEIYSQDDGEFTADTQKAQDYLNKACDSFDGDSCFALASDLEASCSQNDEKCQMVFGLYKKACALGSPQACKNANAIEVGLPFLRF